MKKHTFRRLVALLMSVLLLGQSAYAAELAAACTPEYQYFDTMNVPQDYQDQDLFWFGSTDMTVSEQDPDYYVMRVLRSGSCDSDASITVKFTDLTASYGENYTVWTYDDHTAPEDIGEVPSMVDFMQENSASLYEGEMADEEDLLTQMETEDGAQLVDGSGETFATLTLSDLTDGTAESEVTAAAEASESTAEYDAVINASDYAAIDADQETLYAENYPGHELTLCFAPGETEKLIVVDPKDSSAADGDCVVTVSLENPSTGMAYLSEDKTTSITITDEDTQTPATLSIAKTEYFADSDTVSVTVTRTGSLNSMVYASLYTSSEEAEQGVDYQGADAVLYFPMGITSRTVELQVNHIRDEALTFQVALVNPVGCSLENDTATVTIATAAEAEAAREAAEEAAAAGNTGLLSGSTAAAVTMAAFSNIRTLQTNDVIARGSDTTAEPEVTLLSEEPAAAETGAADPAASADASADASDPGTADSSVPDYSSVPYVASDSAAVPTGTNVDGTAEGTASLSSLTEISSLTLPSSETYRLGSALSPSAFTNLGNAQLTDDGTAWSYSCQGVDYDTWNGIEYHFTNPYLYDGVRVSMDGDYSHLFSESCTYIIIDGVRIWYTEDEYFNANVDAFFSWYQSSTLDIMALTSSGGGQYGKVYSVSPIYRSFRFSLADPSTYALSFQGVDSATAQTYTQAVLDDVTATQAISIGRSLTVSAPKSQEPYAKLTALEFMDQDGNVLYTAYNDTNSRSITVTLTDEVLNALAVSTLNYTRTTSGDASYYIGNVTIRPVYDYIDCTLTVKPDTNGYGSFNGDYNVASQTQLSMHLGDRITLSSTVNSAYAKTYTADGVRYELRDGENKKLENGSGTLDYDSGGSLTLTLTSQNMTIEPTFRALDNMVQVQVSTSDVSRLSSDSLLLKYPSRVSGNYRIYTISEESVSMDDLFPLSASAKDSSLIPLWTVGGRTWSGSSFTLIAGREKADNLVTLSLGSAATYNLSGYAYHADKNLSTGISAANPVIPATNASVSCAGISATPISDGSFRLTGVVGSRNTYTRVMVYCNNSWVAKDVLLSSASGVNLGMITTASNTQDTAHFTNIFAYQNGVQVTDTETLSMDGKQLKLTAIVADGNSYLIGGQKRTETATGVTFYVLDGSTHEIKYALPASSSEKGVWTAVINKFSPDQSEAWTYGDIFYAALTTDRVQSVSLDENGKVVENISATDYAMLSTGYQIIASAAESDPQTISFDPGLDADTVLGSASVSADSTSTPISNEDAAKRATRGYRDIPFLGSINTFLCVSGAVQNVNNAAGGNNGGNNGNNGTGKWRVTITLSIESLPYGGQRLKIGASFSTTKTKGNSFSGGSSPYDVYKQISNPEEAANLDSINPLMLETTNLDDYFKNFQNYYATRDAAYTKQNNLLYGQNGIPKMTFAFTFGIYLDFGLVTTVSETDENLNVESDFDALVFLGAGGYLGMSGSVTYQWQFVGPYGIPMYAGFTGSLSVIGYLGASVDPYQELQIPFSSFQDADGNFTLDNLGLNVDIISQASLKGYFGVGYANVLGGRIIAGLSLVFNYCPTLQDYYPAIDDSWGLSLAFTLGGQLDLLLVSIPISGFSVPITGAGFTPYFIHVQVAYRLWAYCNAELAENRSKYTEEQIAKVNEYLDLLVSDMNNGTADSVFAQHYADAYNYVCGLGMLSAAQKTLLRWEKSPLDMWVLEDDETDAEQAETGSTQDVTEDGYIYMQHTGSAWVANDSAVVNGSFTEASTKTMVENSYAQPDASMTNIDSTHLLSVYLADTSAAGEVVRPTLVYTIYDTETGTWTEPVAVADDGTADYTPSLCDAGDQILITWSSAGTDDTSDPKALLESLDVFTTSFDKAAMTVSAPVQLTDDSYMDYNPSAIYDDETGDLAVYYVKSTIRSAEDILDYVQGSSVLCYRLYDSQAQTWVTDYYESEMPDQTAEQRKTYGETYAGQRFLSSAVDSDQPITDLTVCTGYNGLGIYAYTVDADGDTSDNTDTELYMQVYDFRTHKTYAPIQITDDDVSQAEPQLVRTTGSYTDSDGSTVDGCTYLFWLEDDDTVNYLSVTDLLRHGINEDGSLQENVLSAGTTPISFEASGSLTASVANYRAITDSADNLYLIWSQATESADEEANDDIYAPAPEEIFAAALIREEPTTAQQYNDTTGEGGIPGSSWSDPVRLTSDEDHNDGCTGMIGSDGTLYLMHSQYDITYVGFAEDAETDEETGCIEGNPYEIGDTDLCFSSFTPVGSIEATEFSYSDSTPTPGDTITVTVKLQNTGLTTVKGYTTVFAESRNGVPGSTVRTVSQNDWLPAGSADYVSFDWTVPEDFDQVRLVCEGYEQGYDEPVLSYSEPLEKADTYDVSIGTVTQTGDTFSAEYIVTNTGCCTAAAGSVLLAEFAGLYGHYDTVYGLASDELGSVSIAGLEPGETISGTLEFSVPEQAFDYCGYDQVDLTVYDSNDNTLSDTASNYLVLETPIQTSLTGATCLTPGETTTLTAAMGSEFLSGRSSRVLYTSGDDSVIRVSEDGVVTAVGTGTTTVTATFSPYGVSATLNITVTNNRKFTDVDQAAYYAGAVAWAYDQGITTGTGETIFSPDSGCTRAQFITFLWRAAGSPEPAGTASPFTDVRDSSLYYYKAVLWGAEQGIITGTSTTTFSPDMVCTRCQAVTFLWRYAGKPAPTETVNPFTDVSPTQYYYTATLWGAENGIVKGTDRNIFTPDTSCTRAQTVTFLYRLFNNTSN